MSKKSETPAFYFRCLMGIFVTFIAEYYFYHMNNDLDNLLPLMKKKGVTVSKEAFHHAVNTIFHDVESRQYDVLHKGMDISLQQQYDLIGKDVEALLPAGTGKELTLLDIGCGTGMSTDKLLKSPLGKYISKVYLLDTSKGMLEQCSLKAATWNIPYELIEGDIYSQHDIKADIILTCSVLHHIPNLSDFFAKISTFQNPKGFFIHLQDPNGDYIFNEETKKRATELRNYLRYQKLKANPLKVIVDKVKNKFAGKSEEYIDEVNKSLLASGIIKTPLTDLEIWSITDIHVDNLPNNHGKGISLKSLKEQLVAYRLCKVRSYGFFGLLKSDLPESFQAKEEKWIQEGRVDGRELAAVWQCVN